MVIKKKKINVIRPTLRHKKRYIQLKYFTDKDIVLNEIKLYTLFLKNLEKTYGVFINAETNLTIISFDYKKREIIIRINKEYLSEFISSLFLLNNDLGLVIIKKISSTIKQIPK